MSSAWRKNCSKICKTCTQIYKTLLKEIKEVINKLSNVTCLLIEKTQYYLNANFPN